jgi:propionate CoA-transferase
VSKIVDAATAVASIQDGSTVGCVGVIGWVTPDALLKALGDRFRHSQSPKNRTF